MTPTPDWDAEPAPALTPTEAPAGTGWFCLGCGVPKADPSPGVHCPAGCGMSVTTNRKPA